MHRMMSTRVDFGSERLVTFGELMQKRRVVNAQMSTRVDFGSETHDICGAD